MTGPGIIGAHAGEASLGGAEISDSAPRTPPSTLPRPDDELRVLERAWTPPRGWRLMRSVNNVHVGLFYIATALLFLVLAGVLALLMRVQLAVPDNTWLSAQTYNQIFTMHGTVMMFLFAVPVVEAIAVFLLPAMLGARDLPFPRLSAYAFWAYAFGGLAFFVTLFFGVAPDGGWFMYPPLTSKAHSPGLGADFWLLGIGFIEISAIAGAVELIVGILFTRAPGMTLARMPVYAWAMLVTGFMIVVAFPAIIAGTALLELERAFDWPFFIAERGGDPVLWQHLFWFFGHPEVYIIFLPAAGLVSMMIPVVAGTPLVGKSWVVAALIAVGVISFALWAHHMFTAGLAPLPLWLVSAASMVIAIPSGIQVFAWIATLWKGRVTLTASALFLLGFFALFVLGGLTGVMLAALPFDWQAHDTHFVVAHLHYVLIGGMVFPMIAAVYHWVPLVNGHCMGERAARWIFGLMFVGFNLTFFPMHVAGLLGMPRRVASYAPELGLSGWNLASTIGAFMLAAGFAGFFIDLARTLKRREREHGNPWRAATLEWLPTGHYGTRSVAQVHSNEPLWTDPQLLREVPAGQHWLPGTVTGARETLATRAISAAPWHVLPLPGDSWWPVLAAAGTAGFFLLLTVGWTWTAWACGVLALVSIVRWTWQLDRVPRLSHGAIGAGVRVPVRVHGRGTHAWWGMAVLVTVDATVFASVLFAHVHVSLLATVCPPQGARLPDVAPLWASGLLLLAGSAAIVWAQDAVARNRQLPPVVAALVLATLAGIGGCLWMWHAFDTAGLNPSAEAWSATVAAMIGMQVVHAVALAVIGVYLMARAGARLLQPQARSSIDCCALLWHWTTLQGVLLMVVVQLLPRWLNG
jgi:cytochrome c oxidase subunit I+III